MYHHITDDDGGIAGKYDNFLELSVKVSGKTTAEVRSRFARQSTFHYGAAASLSFFIVTRMPGLSGLGSPMMQSRTTSTSLDLTVSNNSISKRVITRATVRKSSAYTRLIQLSGEDSRSVWEHMNSLYPQADPSPSAKTHEVFGLQVRIVEPTLRIEFVGIWENLGIRMV